jgi:hypothetical protein
VNNFYKYTLQLFNLSAWRVEKNSPQLPLLAATGTLGLSHGKMNLPMVAAG